jgi:hypothetical protein
MASPFENLKIIIKPLQNSGFSLSDFIHAFLENRNKGFEFRQIEKHFNSHLQYTFNETVMLPVYSTLTYKIMEKFEGPGKHLSTYNLDFKADDMRKITDTSYFHSQKLIFF